MTDVIVADSGSAQNFALQNRAVLRIPVLGNFELYCTRYNVPGVQAEAVRMGNPFSDIKLTPNKMQFSDLQVTFLVDDNLANWKSLFRWLQGISRPETFDQYEDRFADVTDCTLHIFDQNNVQTTEIQFFNAMPTYLAALDFDTQVTSSNPMTCLATFTFDYYDFAS